MIWYEFFYLLLCIIIWQFISRDFATVIRVIQFDARWLFCTRLIHHSVFDDVGLRLVALIRNGPPLGMD